MFNGLQPWHIILIVVALILIFGAKKLPEAARGLGRSMRILKSEVNAMHEDGAENGNATQPPAASVPATPAIAPVAPAMTAPIISTPSVAADPVPAAPPAAAPAPAAVQATTIDGKPAVIINGVPTLIDNQAT